MASERDAVPIATHVVMPLAVGVLAGGIGDPTSASQAGVAVVVVAALLVGVRLSRRPRHRAAAAAAAAGLAIGLAAAGLAGLPPAADAVVRLAGRTSIAVDGTIVASEHAGDRIVLTLRAASVRGARRSGSASGVVGVTIAHARAPWPVGAAVRVVGRLRRPRGFGNPTDYDVAASLARRGIHVTMFLWDDRGIALRSTAAAAGPLDRWRDAMETRLAALTAEPVRGYLDAVLLGATTSIDRRTRAALTRTGLAHVVSVSGFHIAVAAGTCLVLGRWLLVRCGRLPLWCDVAKLSAAIGVVPVGVYAAIAGGSVPAARAFLTYALCLGALAWERPPDGARALAGAAVLLALSTPDVAADVSFQLSFVSVAALLLLARSTRPRGLVVQSLQVSVAATLATAPLTAWHFQQVSLIAPLANLLALPLLGPATLVPGLAALPLVAIAPPLADGLVRVAAAAAALGLWVADRLAAPAWAALATPMPSGSELVLCYVTLALWWAPPAHRRRLLAVILVCWAADVSYWTWSRFGDPTLRVTFLSVGQGDAAVVELPYGPTMVVDGGGFPGDFDPGERLIAPFLRARKIMHLDVVALSHPQLDHYGGLATLVEQFAPREFWSSGLRSSSAGFLRLERALRDAGTQLLVVRRGTERRFGAVAVDVLHPRRVDGVDVNDTSVVLRIGYGPTSVLFTGDVEHGAEREMLDADVVAPTTVLKVAHHGSATSTTAAWLAALRPDVAIVSSGTDNRFGFPAAAVVRRLRARGAAVWNTADDGAIRVVSDGRAVSVTPTRVRARR